MEGRVPKSAAERELDRRGFLKAAGAATVLGAAGVLGGNLLLGCAPAKRPSVKAEVRAGYESLRIVGGSLGGESTTAAMALATIYGKYLPEIEWSSCSGSTGTNPIYITKGTLQLGMTAPSNYLDAYGFDKVGESRLRSVNLPRTPSNYFWIVPEDKLWKNITEVPKGTSICPGPAGAPGPLITEAWLRVCGLRKEDFGWLPLGKAEMVDAWRGGKLDAIMLNVSGMAPFLMDMYTSPRKFRAFGLTTEQASRARSERSFERIGAEPPSKSNVSMTCPEVFKEDVVCTRSPTFLACRDDFPEEIAYKMAKAADELRAELNQIYPATKFAASPQSLIEWARPPFDIHSGVARYYKEKGYLK